VTTVRYGGTIHAAARHLSHRSPGGRGRHANLANARRSQPQLLPKPKLP